jgi:hypothetical protein
MAGSGGLRVRAGRGCSGTAGASAAGSGVGIGVAGRATGAGSRAAGCGVAVAIGGAVAGAGAGDGAGTGVEARGISEPFKMPAPAPCDRVAKLWTGLGAGRGGGASGAFGSGPTRNGAEGPAARPHGLERMNGLSSWSGVVIEVSRARLLELAHFLRRTGIKFGGKCSSARDHSRID